MTVIDAGASAPGEMDGRARPGFSNFPPPSWNHPDRLSNILMPIYFFIVAVSAPALLRRRQRESETSG